MGSLLEQFGWHEWLSKTNFSFLAGASHPYHLVKRATECNYASLSINDFDGVYGLARSYRSHLCLQKEGASPLKLNYGAEIHLSTDHELPLSLHQTLALIVLNHQGYFNLCRLCSQAHESGKTGAHLPLTRLLNADLRGIVAIQPMRGLIRGKSDEKVMSHWANLKAAFQDRFFLAVSRHQHFSEDLWIKKTLAMGKQLDLPFLMSQDAFYHHRKQADMHDLLQAIRTNLNLEHAVAHMFPNDNRCLQQLQWVEQNYRPLPIYDAALKNSWELNQQCDFHLGQLRYHYPKEMIPEGLTPQKFLEHLTWQGAKRHYGEHLPGKIETQIIKELKLIEGLSFADYFLTVWDIVNWARNQEILCQGRGSAANSAVCFVLGITSVDPSLFDLLFERFISVERGDPPDIDVDFEHERREEVIQYIYRRYGREKAAMVANVITFRKKGALRAVGKALGIPENIMKDASRLLRTKAFRAEPTEKTTTQVKQQLETQMGQSIPWEKWAFLAERLVGFPRHLGIHSGGFVLSDKPIDWLSAQEPATMPGRTVIQWSKDDIEALGFFKVDILALGMLTAIRKCFSLIKAQGGQELTLANIPHGDGATYAMIQKADTVGTFQIESRAQMSMLPRLRPKNFYDLVIEIAIVRPGPIQGKMIHPFLRRRYGQEPVTFPDPRLEPILRRTMGVPIFQEQVMRVAMAVGSFTGGEANELRRNMGSFSFRGNIDTWIPKLISGMKKNGVEDEFIQSIVDHMKGFASYGFPESHSASFALLAYASCYLKRHYPAAFFTAILNSQPMGFYQPHTLLQAAKHAGVEVLPACVQNSHWDHLLVEKEEGGSSIRLGFRLIRELSEPAIKRMIQLRESFGGWRDLDGFLSKSGLQRLDLTALAAADAFSGFKLERRPALWLAEKGPQTGFINPTDHRIHFPEEDPLKAVHQDFKSMMTSLRDHPTRLIRTSYWYYSYPVDRLIHAKDIPTMRDHRLLTVFGMSVAKQSPGTAKGMLFITLEDDSGFHNLVITPPIYKKYSRTIESHGFLCVSGMLQKDREAYSIMVSQVHEPCEKGAQIVTMKPKPRRLAPVLEPSALVRERSYR